MMFIHLKRTFEKSEDIEAWQKEEQLGSDMCYEIEDAYESKASDR